MIPNAVEPTPWPPATLPVELMTPLAALRRFRSTDDKATTGQYRRVVELLETSTRDVTTVTPAQIAACLDGIQARRLLARIDHRDITLAYISAGAIAADAPLSLEERLAVICSYADEALVDKHMPSVPRVVLDEHRPWALAAATDEWIDVTRRRLEASALEATPITTPDVLVVDGALSPQIGRDDVVGVVKAALDTDWLSDPSYLPLMGGHRSPAFRLSGARRGERNRISAFVRLETATGSHNWGHALVRVEIMEGGAVGLDAACRMVVLSRGTRGGGDPRYLTQLGWMFHTEQFLKRRIPMALTVGR